MRMSSSKQHANVQVKKYSCVRGPLRECRSIRSGASGLPYYCAPLVCFSEVIEFLTVWRYYKPKTKNHANGCNWLLCEEDRDGARSGPGRWHGLLIHAQNCIAVQRGIVVGHPQKAAPQMQPKTSEAFREWLQAVRENASKQSVDSHLWFKSKSPTADTDEDVRRLWYSQKPSTHKSRTDSNAKHVSGREWGARVGVGIGMFAGQFVLPLYRAQTKANSAQIYKCQQCGDSLNVRHLTT